MRFDSLEGWLSWQEQLHPSSIEMTLERPGSVLATMALPPRRYRLITVAGTNGKGSTVAMLEAIYRAAGYRTATYTSPHLMRYNERIRIDGEPVDDARLCAAFERVDQARGETSLTYFEFGTLAAFAIFSEAPLDVVILEVGMGGRLDAVNLLDADVAVVSAVDIDHAAWLGNNRESIALEKAGIFRSGRPAVCSDPKVPVSLQKHAREIGAPLYRLEHEYGFIRQAGYWDWWSRNRRRSGLPEPALRGDIQLQNAAGVLMALELLGEDLPVSQQAIRDGLLTVRLPGRYQVLPGAVSLILDVAHNPQAVRVLARNLSEHPCSGRTHSVLGMLADKEITACCDAIRQQIDLWYPASLDAERGATAETLVSSLHQAGVAYAGPVFAGVDGAYQAARMAARPGDRIVVWGSFHTVAEVLAETV